MGKYSTTRLAVFAILFSCVFAIPAHAIRYELINEAAGDQNGHLLKGFIEFDTPCGDSCTAANIVDFSFSVTGPNTYSYAYEGPNDVRLVQRSGTTFLDAGPKFLKIDFSGFGSLDLLDFEDNSFIAWQANFPQFPVPLSLYISYESPAVEAWAASPDITAPVTIGAVIPEPSALLLCLTTAILCSTLRLPRRKQ
jgi:hypothetical protein